MNLVKFFLLCKENDAPDDFLMELHKWIHYISFDDYEKIRKISK